MTATDAGAAGAPSQHVVAAVDDLHVTFATPRGDVRAVRGISLEIRAGEIVALVGESGSGKTVLGLSMLGLLPPAKTTRTSGTVDVLGVDMIGGHRRETRRVRRTDLGAVFQDPLSSLNPSMRIGRQMGERGASPRRVRGHLGDAGVPEPERRVRQYPHELSGGLRQRVMIAMALATPEGEAGGHSGPQLVVADEPTTALDVSVQAQILLLFDRLRREHGCAVLLVTHDLGVAASVADRIAVLYAGRVCEIGPTADVLERPNHPYTRALLASRLGVDGRHRHRPIGGEPPSPLALPAGCAFAPRCPLRSDECDVTHPDLTTRVGGAGVVACHHARVVDAPVEIDHEPLVVAAGVAADGTAGAVAASDALRLEHVSKSFRVDKQWLRAVADLSLTVPAQGAVALVGESGCGKTTTLRMATGLTQPDAGTVTWADPTARPQLIFQDPYSSLTPWMTIGRQLEERLRVRKVPRPERWPQVLELMRQVGLDERAARAKPRELSGGQRQRAVIARALASNPRLLVCDEPVSALDASLAVRVLDLLDALRADLGVAILVVTHDLAVARRVADEVSVMYLGRIVEQASTSVVFDEPQHPYTQGLLAASPTTEAGRLSPTLGGEPPSGIGDVEGCPFAARCHHATDRCRHTRPELRPSATGGMVACHLAP